MNENHKRVKVTYCDSKFAFVKAIKDATNKSLNESLNIANSVVDSYGHSQGVLLLNESSITVQRWEMIAEMTKGYVKWEYV